MAFLTNMVLGSAALISTAQGMKPTAAVNKPSFFNSYVPNGNNSPEEKRQLPNRGIAFFNQITVDVLGWARASREPNGPLVDAAVFIAGGYLYMSWPEVVDGKWELNISDHSTVTRGFVGATKFTPGFDGSRQPSHFLEFVKYVERLVDGVIRSLPEKYILWFDTEADRQALLAKWEHHCPYARKAADAAAKAAALAGKKAAEEAAARAEEAARLAREARDEFEKQRALEREARRLADPLSPDAQADLQAPVSVNRDTIINLFRNTYDKCKEEGYKHGVHVPVIDYLSVSKQTIEEIYKKRMYEIHPTDDKKKFQYTGDSFTCSDFARSFHAAVVEEQYKGNGKRFAIAEVWSSNHAFNAIVTRDNKILLFEPQTGDFFTPETAPAWAPGCPDYTIQFAKL